MTATLSGFTTDFGIAFTYEGFVPGIGDGVWAGSALFGGPTVLRGLAPEPNYSPLDRAVTSVDWYISILEGGDEIMSPTYTTTRPGCAG